MTVTGKNEKNKRGSDRDVRTSSTREGKTNVAREVRRHEIKKARKPTHSPREGKSPCLLPILDEPVPSTRGHLAGFERVPLGPDAHAVVALERAEHLARLPVPEPAAALSIPRHDEAAVR